MIRNNRLSYSSVGVPWYSFDISQTSLSSFVTSVLVTLISYQAASILFTISFGRKKKHETKLKNLGILLLTGYLSSPLPILNSIYRFDWLTRLYYKGEIPKNTRISRDSGRVKLATVLVLLLLVVAAPIIDTVLVTLTLSRTRELTFEEAGFRGVAFGVENDDGAVETIPFVSFCDRAQYEERAGDDMKSFFHLCTTPNLPENESENVTGVEISLLNQHQIWMRVVVQGSVILSAKWAQLTSDDGERAIGAEITERSVDVLVEVALDGFEKRCGERNDIGRVPEKKTNIFTSENRLLSSVRVSCDGVRIHDDDKKDYSMEIMESMKSRLTFIETETTLVRNITDIQGSFKEHRNGVLLLRTGKNSSLFILLLVGVGLLLVRGILELVLANDVEEGLERSVRDRLGLTEGIFGVCHDGQRVHFRKKYQVGDWCHVGMKREERDEVGRLRGGMVGTPSVALS